MDNWAPAAGCSKGCVSIPVQVMVESKTSDGLITQEISSIVEYRPYPLLNEEGYFAIFKECFFKLKFKIKCYR